MTLWTNRNFLTAWAGQLVSTFGNNLYYLALPWYVLAVTRSRTDLVFAGMATSLPGVAGLVSGVFVDRWPKKRVMIMADGARLALAAGLGVLAEQRGPLGLLLAAVMLFEVTGTLFSPAESALLPLLVVPSQIADAEGLQQSSTSLAGLAGKLIGGPLLALLGAPMLFFANAASFAVSVVSLYGVRVDDRPLRIASRASFVAEWKTGLLAVWKSPWLSHLVWGGLIVNFGLSSLTIVLTTWVKTGEHGTAVLLGLSTGAFLAGSVVGGIAFGMLVRRVQTPMFQRSPLLFGLCIGLMGLIPSPVWTISCMGLAGLSAALFNSEVGTRLVQYTPAPLRGRVFSTFGSLMLATGPLGLAVFGGLLAAGLPVPLLFGIMGGFAVIAGIVTRAPLSHEAHDSQHTSL